MIMDAAAITGQLNDPYPLNVDTDTATVVAFEYDKARGNINEVHTVMKVRIPLVTIHGIHNGRTIFVIIRLSLHPSIFPAHSKSIGISPIKLHNNIIQ